jgi:hypothetical protein
MAFTLTTDTERAAGFVAANRIRDLMSDLNRQDIYALCAERSDHADSVYSRLGRTIEAIFRQLGLTPREAEDARYHTTDSDAETAYDYVVKQRPCSSCGGSGQIEICDASTDGLIGWRDCGVCDNPPF